MTYKMVSGTIASINNIITNYKMNNNESLSIQILLLTTQYSASGINLENTSDIVLYHSMSEDKTNKL